MTMEGGNGFEELEHTADWSIKVRGRSWPSLLELSARGMLSLMGVRPTCQDGTRRRIDLRADDRETLLVEWLEDILFHLETRGVLPIDIALEAGEGWLRGSLLDVPASRTQKPIKAVTFHNLEVIETPGGWEAQIVFDV
jgi:SHS2 domain-containing protein